MAINTARVNRCEEWSSDQKKVIRKLFTLAQSAATGGDATIIDRSIVHTTLAGKLDAGEEQAMRVLMSHIRTAIGAADNAYDIDSTVSTFPVNGNKKRIYRQLADEVIAQI